jgi:hypothetical protein
MMLSCGNVKKKNEYPAINVTGYLKGQIKLLDSIPYGLLKVTANDKGKIDSVYITKKDVWNLVDPFLSATIDKEQLETDYTETSFADATIESVVITYDAKDKDAAINQITVYIRPDNGEINQIYITGYFTSGKQIMKKQLLWLHNQGCTIISSSTNESSTLSQTITEKLIWQ